jgi:hypothetical protein
MYSSLERRDTIVLAQTTINVTLVRRVLNVQTPGLTERYILDYTGQDTDAHPTI